MPHAKMAIKESGLKENPGQTEREERLVQVRSSTEIFQRIMFDVGEVAHLVCLGRMHRGGTASLIYVWRRVRFSLCLRCYNDMAVYKKIKLKGFRMKYVKRDRTSLMGTGSLR